MNLNSKHHAWRKAGTANHLHSNIPTLKCAGSSLVPWGCFSAAGTEGLVRVEEKLNAPKYWDYWALMKTQSRAFWTLDWAEGSPSNRTMTLSTQQEWFIHNAVNVLSYKLCWVRRVSTNICVCLVERSLVRKWLLSVSFLCHLFVLLTTACSLTLILDCPCLDSFATVNNCL